MKVTLRITEVSGNLYHLLMLTFCLVFIKYS